MDFITLRSALARPLSVDETCVLSTIESWFVNCDFLFISERRVICISSEKGDVLVILLSASTSETDLALVTLPAPNVVISDYVEAFTMAALKGKLDVSLLEHAGQCVALYRFEELGTFSIEEFRSVFGRFVMCAGLAANQSGVPANLPRSE